MRRALILVLLPAAALLATAAMPASAPGRSPLLTPVPEAEAGKLRGKRWWVKVLLRKGERFEAILVSYRSKTGEFTVAPDEKDLLKQRQIPDSEIQSLELLRPYVPKLVDPTAGAWTDVKKDLSDHWKQTLAEVLKAKEDNELPELIKESEDRLSALRIGSGGMRAARAAHEVMRAEIMKLLFAYCEQKGKADKPTVLAALDRMDALGTRMKDRWVRAMYRRRMDALRRSVQSGGGIPKPDTGPGRHR